MKRTAWSLAACVAASLLGSASASAEGTVNTGYFGGVAIMGYDPVAYFTEGRSRKGSEEFAYEWLGTPWHFATAKHRDLFMSEPVKYAPQFGGYCAGEVAFDGITVNIDPDAWRIINGKLYLSYDKPTDEEWKAYAENLLAKAVGNWPRLEAKLKQGTYY